MRRHANCLILSMMFMISGLAQGQETTLTLQAALDQPVLLDYTLPEIRKDPQPASLKLVEVKGKRNLVLFFFSEQCGVTFYYKSRLQQLQKDFQSKGFVFVGVCSGKPEKPGERVEIAESRYLKMPFVADVSGDLARYFAIRQSLTFAVVDTAGRLRYRGGFDDNVDAKKVKRAFLRDALRSLAAGKPIAVREGRALGCALVPAEPAQ